MLQVNLVDVFFARLHVSRARSSQILCTEWTMRLPKPFTYFTFILLSHATFPKSNCCIRCDILHRVIDSKERVLFTLTVSKISY